MWRAPKGSSRCAACRIGISSGCRTKKIYALVDVLGRPTCVALTPGNKLELNGADVLSDETVSIKRVIGGCGYEANRITVTLREQGTIPVLPGRRNHRHLSQHDEFRHKDRWLVEAMFRRLKDFCVSAVWTPSCAVG